MADNPIKPFVKRGAPLGFVAQLKERGLWPPRLHDRDKVNRDRKTATPYLVVPTTVFPSDNGSRPQPNSKVFHSQGVWIEDAGGTLVTTPAVGGSYRIKCRVRNLGAFPAYSGLADFFVNKPAVFTAVAGSAVTLPSLGHTGFTLGQGQEAVITCPNLWQPATAADAAASIVVHAYDPLTDGLVYRFDARKDRHVGRHDFTPDVYVRDWTDSAAVHDNGLEPSARYDFYRASDVWNRRSAAPGAFVNDQPQNQNPQAGNGAAGDNFIFARISRNDASVEQTVRAHFLFAEFGTGSPFVDCSTAPDPSVTLLPGELAKLVSLPWHLHPTSSHHLCIAVQVYSDADPYISPGLLGNTPGWPTTDMMVINDNNKAQRNIDVWDGVPETEGFYLGIVFNAATFVRDVVLAFDASEGSARKLRNARVAVAGAREAQPFRPGGGMVLKGMLPGERRWLAFSYDAATFEGDETLTVSFNEKVGDAVVNGFAFGVRAASAAAMLTPVLDAQTMLFYRLSEGMGVESAKEGLVLCQRLQESGLNVKSYAKALPAIAVAMARSLNDMSARFGGVKDVLGVGQNVARLSDVSVPQIAVALALHNKVLHQADAFLTMAAKSRGDTADILFTVRVQEALYRSERLAASPRAGELLKMTDAFIQSYPMRSDRVSQYVPFVRALMPYFEATIGVVPSGPVRARYAALAASLAGSPEEVQSAHLSFLNAVLLSPAAVQPETVRVAAIG